MPEKPESIKFVDVGSDNWHKNYTSRVAPENPEKPSEGRVNQQDFHFQGGRMTTSFEGTANISALALGWAQDHFPFQSHDIVTNHPWARTLRLQGENGPAFLKIVPNAKDAPKLALPKIAKYLKAQVPQLISSDPGAGFFLYQDHEGRALETPQNAETRQAILTHYADLQTSALKHPDLLAALPRLRREQQYDRLMAFLTVPEEDTAPGITAAYFLRDSTVRRYHGIFASVADMFGRFLTADYYLRPTINHCDLRFKNVALKPDGKLVIFDWDDAVCAPPGLSLHALFSGSAGPYAALCAGEISAKTGMAQQDRFILDKYVDQLCANGDYEKDQLVAALPAIICVGVIHYILAFADYPVTSQRQRDRIGKNIRRRLSDLMTLAQMLVVSEPAALPDFAEALRAAGRTERADRVIALKTSRAGPDEPTIDFAKGLTTSDAPGVFPTLTLTAAEQTDRQLTTASRDLGVALFQRHGTLMVKNAIPRDLLASCHREFFGLYDKYLHQQRHDDALRVGDKRFMISLKFSGSFAEPALFASPLVLPILNRLLGKEAILGSLTAVASLPGSANQRMHKDNSALFKDHPDMPTPSFSIAMIVPLVPLNSTIGATRVVKGSHRVNSKPASDMDHQDPVVDLGSCFLMDCRLSHRGMANNSDQVRPIISMVYQRPWYRDYLNFKKQKPMDIDADRLNDVPAKLQHLVSWAVDL